MTPTLNLEDLTLAAGGHTPGDNEMCVMEAAAYMAAARAAARAALAPTVALLQESAHELVVRMATITLDEAA